MQRLQQGALQGHGDLAGTVGHRAGIGHGQQLVAGAQQVAGFGEFGAIRLRENPAIAMMLDPLYVRYDRMGIA